MFLVVDAEIRNERMDIVTAKQFCGNYPEGEHSFGRKCIKAEIKQWSKLYNSVFMGEV
jgi:hypothetical protein